MTREGEGRLCLALGLLAGTCVYAYSRVFTGRAWLIPALAASWGAIALSRWLTRLRVPRVVAALVSAVVGAWFVLLVVFPQTTLFGIPSPGSVHKALSSIRIAEASVSAVTAPIAPDPGYLALAMVGAWIAGAASGALIGVPGRRGVEGASSSLSPSLLAPAPWIVLFTVAAGVGQGRGRLFDAALVFAAVLIYLLAEGWRTLGRLPRLDGAIRLGALSMASAVLLPNLVPGYNAGPIFPWARIGPLTETTISPLVQIKPFLLNQSNVSLFKVTAGQPAYWRLTSLDHFDGVTWSSEGTYNPASGALATPAAGLPTESIRQRYSISGLGGIWVPAAYQVSRVSGLKTSIDPTSQTLIVGALHPGTSYDVVSSVTVPTGQQLSAAGAGPAPAAEDLSLPAATVGTIGNIARSIVGSNTNPYDQAVALQRYLRSFTYDEHVAADASTNYLFDFLTRTRAGFCEQFAGSMAVMLRILNIPARVAVGFLPGQSTGSSTSGTTYSVTGRSAHAWPEAYFSGIGWVAFEPTPRADAPAPPYTVAPAPAPNPQVAGSPSAAASAASSSSPLAVPSAANPTTAPQKAPNPAITAARRAMNDLLVALAAVLAGLLIARETRLRFPSWVARSPQEKALAAYDEFTLRAADAYEPRQPGQTEAEYGASVVQGLSLPAPGAGEVKTLTRTYQRAAYSLRAPVDPELEGALHANRALRRELFRGADWRGKVRLTFSPRPLHTRASGPDYDRGPVRTPRSSKAPSAARKV